MTTYLDKHPQILQEAYFGKSKELLKAEGLIAKMIKKFETTPEKWGDRVVLAATLNKSPLNKEIEKCFEKQFGFKEMVLHWDGQPYANAYTYSRGIIKVMSDGMPGLPIKQSDGGYYDANHSHICVVCVFAGLVDIEEGITPGEIMATILHEIGHNFQCTPVTNIHTALEWAWAPILFYDLIKNVKMSIDEYKAIKKITSVPVKVSQLPAVKKTIIALSTMMVTHIRRAKEAVVNTASLISYLIASLHVHELAKTYFEQVDKYIIENKFSIIEKYRQYAERLAAFDAMMKKYPSFVDYDKIWFIFKQAFFFLIDSPIAIGIGIIDNQSNYSGEVFADSFATAYGYGIETVSIQKKFSNLSLSSSYGLKKENKFNSINQYLYISARFASTLLDPHPLALTRITNQIEKLKSDVKNDDLDPRVKKEILNQIKEMEDLAKEYLQMPEDYRYLSVIMNFNRINKVYFNGNLDYRNFINKLLNLGLYQA